MKWRWSIYEVKNDSFMKKVLLILVWLFSSSVVAEDNIEDSSVIEANLVCGYINELDIIQINGWKFEPANTKNKVIYYTYITIVRK